MLVKTAFLPWRWLRHMKEYPIKDIKASSHQELTNKGLNWVSDRGVPRIWNRYLKISWKFLTLMTLHTDILDNNVHRGKLTSQSENIINYRITSTSNHYCQIRILARERPEIFICCFLFVRQEHVHVNAFLHKHLYV